MSEFDNLVAIVTGGASGIGAATADLLLQRGARVAVLDRSLDGVPQDIYGVDCDVTDSIQVIEAIADVVQHFGSLDVVINNAGIGAAGDVTANADEEWHHVFDVNVFGIARVSRAALPHLRHSAHAVIVNTSSIFTAVGVPNRALYSASKGAVAALTLAMAADHVKDGIRVNAVVPGTADTPWVARLLDAAEDREATAAALRARQPMGRLVSAEEVAHAVVYLASPLSSSTTGTLLAVDGGMIGLRLS
jgi:NAD(P)-dependent dehydrogenase (short-subunit alcohol dehydrogenase family)